MVDTRDKTIPYSIIESYRYLTQGIIEGLKQLGINAEFAPVNDIILNGKKISGNAQTRRWDCVLQHGTILLKSDIRTMFRVLKVRRSFG